MTTRRAFLAQAAGAVALTAYALPTTTSTATMPLTGEGVGCFDVVWFQQTLPRGHNYQFLSLQLYGRLRDDAVIVVADKQRPGWFRAVRFSALVPWDVMRTLGPDGLEKTSFTVLSIVQRPADGGPRYVEVEPVALAEDPFLRYLVEHI